MRAESDKTRIFIAWDSEIPSIRHSFERLQKSPPPEFTIEVLGVGGSAYHGAVLEDTLEPAIERADRVLALVDRPNANMGFELGLALGRRKPAAIAHAGLDLPSWLELAPFSGHLVCPGGEIEKLRKIIVDRGTDERPWIQAPADPPPGDATILLCPRAGDGSAVREHLADVFGDWNLLELRSWSIRDLTRKLAGVRRVVWVITTPPQGSIRDGEENACASVVAGFAYGRGIELHVMRSDESRSILDVANLGVEFSSLDDLVEQLAERTATTAETAGRLEGQPALVSRWRAHCLRVHREIPIVGYRDHKKFILDIEKIYVPLAISSMEALRTPHGSVNRESWSEDELVSQRADVGVDGAFCHLEKQIAEGQPLRGLSIVGDPGSGKTTLLQHIFCKVSRQGSAAVGLPEGLTPVLLRFSRLRADGLGASSLVDLAEQEAKLNGHEGAGRALLADSSRALLFLLDGLDEVRDEATRIEVADWLCDEALRWENSRFVATCRYASWRKPAGRLGGRFFPFEVLRFGRDDAADYVRQWFSAVVSAQRGPEESPDAALSRATEKAERLLEAMNDPERPLHSSLWKMTRNPLLLSTICLVHHAREGLPDSRAELYDESLGLLIETWGEQHQSGRGLPYRSASRVLQPLAWAMQESLDRADTSKEISRARLLELIAPPLEGRPRGLEGMEPSEFLDRIAREIGVLVSPDFERYQFLHLTFQEYLAACDARTRGDAAGLAERLGQDRWREPILLSMSLDGIFVPFMRAALAGAIEAHREILGRCLDEARAIEDSPFVEVLARESEILEGRGRPEGIRLSPGALAALLRLFVGRDRPGIAAAAKPLMNHPDREVAALAAQLTGISEEPAVSPEEERAGGELWREPTSGMSFVWVRAGELWMGSSCTEGEEGYDPEAASVEEPRHRVEISRGFWLGQYPVTNAEYRRFVDSTDQPEPESFRRERFGKDRQPVTGVSWENARRFCEWLSAELPSGHGPIELPTEAEWEWAARGEDGRKYPWGSSPPPSVERAIFGRGAPDAVGERPLGAGPFGAQDQAGNVWEWCADRYGAYSAEPQVDPTGPASGAAGVLRGGSWIDVPRNLRCAGRLRSAPGYRLDVIGFRVVCRVPRQRVSS